MGFPIIGNSIKTTTHGRLFCKMRETRIDGKNCDALPPLRRLLFRWPSVGKIRLFSQNPLLLLSWLNWSALCLSEWERRKKKNLRKTLRLLWPFIWCTFLLCQTCAIKRTSTKIAISSFIKSETKQKRLPYVLAACCNLQIRQLSLSVNRPKLREIAANFYNGKLKSFKRAKFVCWLSKPTSSSQKSLIKRRKVFSEPFFS